MDYDAYCQPFPFHPIPRPELNIYFRDRTLGKYRKLIREELDWVRPRIWAMNIAANMLPIGVGPRMRPLIYRAFGMTIGPHTTKFGAIQFIWYGNIARRVRFGDRCFISRDLVIDPSADVTVGDSVVTGPQVALLTATHEISGSGQRAGAMRKAPIAIGNGVWIGARVTILPGVTVGDGAILAAGAVVVRDVLANTIVGGVPARVLRVLSEEQTQSFNESPGAVA